MGSIYKPKYTDKDCNTKESAVYWIKYYYKRKPHRESTKSKKLSVARNLLKLKEGDTGRGRMPVAFDKVTNVPKYLHP